MPFISAHIYWDNHLPSTRGLLALAAFLLAAFLLAALLALAALAGPTRRQAGRVHCSGLIGDLEQYRRARRCRPRARVISIARRRGRIEGAAHAARSTFGAAHSTAPKVERVLRSAGRLAGDFHDRRDAT